jgi:hypothetical protein
VLIGAGRAFGELSERISGVAVVASAR